jgi:ABC-2 type transport system permease protein
MKVVSEDKKQRTDQLLYSLPLSMNQIVIGKFLAMAVVLFLPVIVLLIMPPILNIYGDIALGTAYSSIFAYYMLGLSLTAIGLFISSLTDNQLAAAAITFAIILVSYLMTGLSSYIPSDSFSSYISFAIIILLLCIVIWLMTKSKIASAVIAIAAELVLLLVFLIKKTSFEGLIHKVISGISLFDKTENFFYGIFDLTGVVYFISVIVLFVFLTIQSMEKRRWS